MIEQKIKVLVEDALKALSLNDNVLIIKSNRPDLCDYQYDGAFRLAKQVKENPIIIGENIVKQLEKRNEFKKVECIKPGFINFTISDEFIMETLNEMIIKPKFNITMPKKEKIVLDYGGANVAKPLHVGHLRPAIIGEAIKRILLYMNQDVISDVHLGDYGLQIGEVIYGLKEENIKPEEITLKDLERIYPKISALIKENEEIKNICATITKDLQDGKLYRDYFEAIISISKKDIKKMYDYLNVSFDYWYGESDAYSYIEEMTKILEKEHLLKESDGAKIVEIGLETDKKELPPLIYQKSNGAYLYGTTDLATIYERKKDFNPKYILYVADLRQNLHFTQVFRVAKKTEELKNINYEFLGFGTINGSDGKPFKTRGGNTPKLEELFKETKEIFKSKKEENKNISNEDLDIITNAIIKFADLQNNREKDYIFDINKFSDVTGKTGPYILYTYLRAKKITINMDIKEKLSPKIYNDIDRKLRMKVIEFTSILEDAYKSRLPSYLANYVYDLCVLMNAFYENNHINNLVDKEKQSDWVTLINLVTNIIYTSLDLLGIKIPTKM